MTLINLPQVSLIDDADAHLIKGDGRSVYQLKHAEKSPGRLASEFWASHVVLLFRAPGFDLAQFREWQQMPFRDGGSKTNAKKLADLCAKHPDLGEAIDAAISDLPS